MANWKLICCGTLIALSGCATTTSVPPQPDTPAVQRHQDPSDPNPDALPSAVLEWVEAVCKIPDPQARERALKEGREKSGWNLDCPDGDQAPSSE